MDAHSSATSSVGLPEGELENRQNQQPQHFTQEGASAVMASSQPAGADSQGRKRSHPENPSPDTEVMALSPNTLMATNRFFCEVCNKGFRREQNLQLHRRGHNLPWKIKKKTNYEVGKKVYICPEIRCVHHDPSRALGDLTRIKKHFSRKHGEKKFSCRKCNKKYALHCDWKAHDKICGIEEYKCECGTTFSRCDSLISHRSSCDTGKEVARHTPNGSSYSSMAASNPAGSMSLGSAAGSSRPNSFTSLLSRQSVGSAFQPIHPPNMALHPFKEPNLSIPRASDFSGNHGFPSYTAPSNMFSFGFNGGADLNIPQNDLNLNINNSLGSWMMNAESSAYPILNSTPAPQLSANALQMPTLAGSNSNNVALMRRSISGGMKFNNYGGTSAGGTTFQEMYTNLNVGNADGMWVCEVNSNVGVQLHMNVASEHCDEKHTRDFLGMGIGGNSLTGAGMVDDHNGGIGTSQNVGNADGMWVCEVNNNVGVQPHMNVGSEHCDEKHTRDFLDMGIGMNSLTGAGIVDDHNGNEIGTTSSDSEATISAVARPLSFSSFRHGF